MTKLYFLCLVVFVLGCGGADAAGIPPVEREILAASSVFDGFETWKASDGTTTLGSGPSNPAPDCQAAWMDPLTSWCSSSAPPTGWVLQGPPVWNEHINRFWEAFQGKHAIRFKGCTKEILVNCERHILVGPTWPAAPGKWEVSMRVRSGASMASVVPPMGVRLVVHWGSNVGCVDRLATTVVDAPPDPPIGTWVVAVKTVDAPPGTTCARWQVEWDAIDRPSTVDALSAIPL